MGLIHTLNDIHRYLQEIDEHFRFFHEEIDTHIYSTKLKRYR